MSGKLVSPEVVWEDPPKKRARPGIVDWLRPALEKLQEQPGRWARLDHGRMHNMRSRAHRLTKAFAGEYEFTVRNVEGEAVLYGRFVGDGWTEVGS